MIRIEKTRELLLDLKEVFGRKTRSAFLQDKLSIKCLSHKLTRPLKKAGKYQAGLLTLPLFGPLPVSRSEAVDFNSPKNFPMHDGSGITAAGPYGFFTRFPLSPFLEPDEEAIKRGS